jgi:hypothetical protein
MADLLQTTQSVPNTQTLLQPEYPELQTLGRQQAYANALMGQGLNNQPQGQMVSGFYVKPSALQQLSPVVQALTGAYLGNKVEKKQQELASLLRGKQSEAVQNYMQALNPQQSELAGPTPTGAPLQTVNTPDYNAAFAAATSPYAPAPLQAAGYEMLKDKKLAEGETLNRFNFNTGQLTPYAAGGEKLPNEIKAAAAVLGLPLDQSKWTAQDRAAINNQMLQKIRAGVSNVNVSMGKDLSSQIGDIMKESKASTVGAMQTNASADRILNTLAKNNAIQGPGADIRLTGMQLANAIGANGKDDQQKLENTRTLVQETARLAAQASAMNKGQGAVSDYERKLYAKVAGGDINLSPGELALIAKRANEGAQYQIQQHQNKINYIKSNPQTAPLAPFYEVQPINSTATNGNKVVDYSSLK